MTKLKGFRSPVTIDYCHCRATLDEGHTLSCILEQRKRKMQNETCTYPQCKCIVGTPAPKCPRTNEFVPEDNFKAAKQEAHTRILELAWALLDVVKAAGPQGAPAGPMYAACMSRGMSLSQFERLMDLLVVAGKVRKSSHCYFAI